MLCLALMVAVGIPPFAGAIALGALSNVCGCLTQYAIGSGPVMFGAGGRTWQGACDLDDRTALLIVGKLLVPRDLYPDCTCRDRSRVQLSRVNAGRCGSGNIEPNSETELTNAHAAPILPIYCACHRQVDCGTAGR